MKINLLLKISLFLLLPIHLVAQKDVIFPIGEKAPNVHHTGDVWLNHLAEADETFPFNVVLATFAPGAKLNWHKHPKGQELYITKGVGFYQERNKEVQVVKKGDVVTCLPNVEHWHAAAPNSDFAYWAITNNAPTEWTQELTQEEYDKIEVPNLPSIANTEEEITELSKNKWKWMSEKNIEKLTNLFHPDAQFVHMGGTWGTQRELDIIKGGGIWYKKADVHESSVDIMGNTAVLLNRITLVAEVGGNEVTNPFIVTEVYVNNNGHWQLANLSFVKQLTPE